MLINNDLIKTYNYYINEELTLGDFTAMYCFMWPSEEKDRPISPDGTTEHEDSEDTSATSSRSLMAFLFPISSTDDNHVDDYEPISMYIL